MIATKLRVGVLAAFALAGIASCACHTHKARSDYEHSRITYDSQCLTIDGHDKLIFSGAFHYFRCPKALWPARFEKIKDAGFNTVETYIAWNQCEAEMPASLDDYSKINLRDIDDWLTMAEHYGFYVIVRPGPYICAEWDHGGFPGWLITKRPADFPKERTWLRSDDPTYIAWSKHWYDAVCPMLAKHEITGKSPGSPGIILFQVENEYDYSGMSEEVKMNYVKALAEEAMAKGINVPLFTCWTHSIRGNTDPVLSKIFDSCNFYPGWGVDSIAPRMHELRDQQPNAPMMTTELQGGWFTGTNEEQPLRPDSDHYRQDLVPAQIQNLTLFAWQNGDTITNYYMLFGGTNFGDTGAQGIATSYDYSAPIRENGGVGDKYRVVQALGEMIRNHGARLARARNVDCQTTTGFSDVTVVEKRDADNSRYLFIRTDQHRHARSGTARVQEPHGKSIIFNYQLDPFGSKVLYLPLGVTDPTKGQWLPREQAEIHRPSELPGPITITDIRSSADPTPRKWKPMRAGEHLADLGIYDSRFVYYDATVHLSAEDLTNNPNLALKIDHASGDHILAVLNGEPIEPMPQTADAYFSPGSNLHSGDNHLTLLYETSGFANIGGAMEKLAGVSDIALTVVPNNEHAITGWRMHLTEPGERADNRPEIAADYDDSVWQKVSTSDLDANQLRPHQWAIFRTKVNLSSDDLAGQWTNLNFARIDDEGWIFVNGQRVGRGLRWDQPVQCDAASALHAGENTIAVVVHNNDNEGGLGPVSWAPAHVQTVGSVSNLRYCAVTKNSPDFEESRAVAGTSPLLTWYRLNFNLPKRNPEIWVPWLIRLHAHGNGFIYLNGHALGRYWQGGGQSDYFLPDCWLNFGGKRNVITLCLRGVDQTTAVDWAEAIPYTAYAEWREK